MKDKEMLLLGDEAASYACVDAGVTGVFGYPGTPATEAFERAEAIIEKMDKSEGRIAQWAANEKVAYEMALGVSYTGKRAIVTMKHVGLNVAMDPFVNSAITGARGGLVVLVADDPSMHSSQNEQDSRYLADFAHVPCFEPATPQEVYDFTIKAFEVSENLQIPVMLRLVTRLAHTRGIIKRGETKKPTFLGVPPKSDIQKWILVPSMAKIQYKKLREKLPQMLSVASEYNQNFKGTSKVGVVVAGMGRAYFDQLCREKATAKEFNKLEIKAYPVDIKILNEFVKNCGEIFVFEEDYPYLEDSLIKMAPIVHGRRDGTIAMEGELNSKVLWEALGFEIPETKNSVKMELPPRLPRLCDGCGHSDAFRALKDACVALDVKDPRFFGDIGCYTLGAYAPFESIHTCVEMGASVGMSLGAALAGHTPSVGVIGDSTFMHSGIPTLISMAKSKVNVTLIIVDNNVVAMTGQQDPVAENIFSNLAVSVGFSENQIHTLVPLPKQHEKNVEELKKVLSHDGPDIVIFKRECIQAMRKGLYKKRTEKKTK